MATQMQLARQGIITEAMLQVAAQEQLAPEVIRAGVAAGTIAVCCNINHKNLVPRGVGQGLAVKVNANIGTSSAYPDPEPELAKLRAAIDAGADSVMDLSTGDNIDASRKAIIAASTVMVGTVPIYQATVETIKKRGAVVEMTKEDLFEVIRQQAADGVVGHHQQRVQQVHRLGAGIAVGERVAKCGRDRVPALGGEFRCVHVKRVS